MDKLVLDARRRRNAQSLVLEASGKEQAAKIKASVPAAVIAQEAVPALAATTPGPPSPSPGPGKGKGKGKGKSKSEPDSDASYTTDQYPGTEIKDIPEDERCCIFHLYTD